VTRWQETTSEHYRKLEREQRALAADASSAATRDIHLEFADRYRAQAEQLDEKEQRRPASGSGAGQE
jgi:hypothetical protein